MDDAITRLLHRIADGEPGARDELMPLIYHELKHRARSLSARERGPLTLGTTGLLHEGYLRLLGSGDARFENRRHFFAAAGEAMRRILIDRARGLARVRHGGALERVDLVDDISTDAPSPEQVLALDQLLDQLEALDAMRATVVKLRWYGGLTVAETAQALDVSTRTINRAWTEARAWLGARFTDAARAQSPDEREEAGH